MHWPNSENASNTVELLHIQHRIVTNPQYLREMLRNHIFASESATFHKTLTNFSLCSKN